MIERPIYMKQLLPLIDQPLVKVLYGIRRCGKSSLLQLLIAELQKRGVKAEQIVYYRFDSLKYANLTSAPALYEELRSHIDQKETTYLFLDEIQEVEDWEKVVNSLLIDGNVDIYVTGSNSRMMSSEISTYLTGRYVSVCVKPLCFREYLQFRKEYGQTSDNELNIKAELMRYLRTGGFPVLHLRELTEETAYTIVKDIYNSVIFTDIVKRSQIRKADLLERVVKYCFDNIGQTFSASTLAKFMKSQKRSLEVETVYSYLDKLEKAYILQRCPRYDIRGKEHLKTQEKYYLSDLSLRHALLGYDASCMPAFMENVIYNELSVRGYNVYVGKQDNNEIDFIASKAGNKLYVQVTYTINSPETERREYERLLAIKDNYPKYVIRLDEGAAGNYQGIRTMHLADFLLSREY
ncbi:ATP-binding protein [bacterium]|nr:ATP-binding protein [bacterium]